MKKFSAIEHQNPKNIPILFILYNGFLSEIFDRDITENYPHLKYKK